MPARPLDMLGPDDIIRLMDRADARALAVVKAARPDIARAATAAARAVGGGGRLIYVGAGTSGRLGVLDASECGPTFSAKPGQVTGVIAGGAKALYRAVEGAEDDEADGRARMAALGVCEKDMVMGITASGTTPFVLAALSESATRGADVWLLTCGPGGKGAVPHGRLIMLDTGREVIQGSSRLAAGTATKLALNRITTAAFIMMGKVYGDLMVDVVPANAKLVRRAAGIIMDISGCTEKEAEALLARSGKSPKVAVVMHVMGVGRRQAEELLAENGGFLRAAIGR